jgi:hypothetical protein
MLYYTTFTIDNELVGISEEFSGFYWGNFFLLPLMKILTTYNKATNNNNFIGLFNPSRSEKCIFKKSTVFKVYKKTIKTAVAQKRKILEISFLLIRFFEKPLNTSFKYLCKKESGKTCGTSSRYSRYGSLWVPARYFSSFLKVEP